jgi:hypothetical protein
MAFMTNTVLLVICAGFQQKIIVPAGWFLRPKKFFVACVPPATPTQSTIMSLHIDSSPEARERMSRQRRLNAVTSVTIAMLSITLTGMLLALVMLPGMFKEEVQIIMYDPPELIDVNEPTPVKITRERLQPSAPASPSHRVIVASTAAAFSIPVPEVSSELGTLGGVAEDFGDGWIGDSAGQGIGAGDASMFGSTQKGSGGLAGTMYDFKQTPDGREVKYNLGDPAEFVDRVLRLQRSRFSDASLSKYFQAPQTLYLTQLAIPNSLASEGPKFFGAEGSIKPSGWLVRYRGRVVAPKDGTYRFSGIGDDYLTVSVNGKIRLVACWPDTHPQVAGRWDASEPTGKFASPYDGGARLVYGDWIRLRRGEVMDLDIVIGERPGGKVGFLLNIEEKGVEYRKAADGRPILPLFTTVPIDEAKRSKISRDFGAFELEWEQVPVFAVR